MAASATGQLACLAANNAQLLLQQQHHCETLTPPLQPP
jgi:hypothetical protein